MGEIKIKAWDKNQPIYDYGGDIVKKHYANDEVEVIGNIHEMHNVSAETESEVNNG